MLDRKAILDFEDKDIATVTVEKFGGEVCIASLSAAEADSVGKLAEDGIPGNVIWTILGVCDEKGNRLFTVEDAEALGKKPAKALTEIAKAVLAHNGLDSGEAAKNASSETENGDSASASPPTSDEPSQS